MENNHQHQNLIFTENFGSIFSMSPLPEALVGEHQRHHFTGVIKIFIEVGRPKLSSSDGRPITTVGWTAGGADIRRAVSSQVRATWAIVKCISLEGGSRLLVRSWMWRWNVNRCTATRLLMCTKSRRNKIWIQEC